MKRQGRIDRTKHEVDITERVLEGGVWAGPGQLEGARFIDLDIGVVMSSLDTAASPVQVRTVPREPDKD